MVTFKVLQNQLFAIVQFEFEDVIEPAYLYGIKPPDPVAEGFAHKGVILSGRGPVWLYGYLVHFYHPTKFVATFGPRLNGAVVVESHGSEWKPRDVIPAELFTQNKT